MKIGNFAVAISFDCETVESNTSSPTVQIVAKVALDSGHIHHINTGDIKGALEDAVKNAVWYCEKAPKAEAAKDEK